MWEEEGGALSLGRILQYIFFFFKSYVFYVSEIVSISGYMDVYNRMQVKGPTPYQGVCETRPRRLCREVWAWVWGSQTGAKCVFLRLTIDFGGGPGGLRSGTPVSIGIQLGIQRALCVLHAVYK